MPSEAGFDLKGGLAERNERSPKGRTRNCEANNDVYLHLGNDALVRKDEIVGVFDLDNTSQSVRTREFLAKAEKEKAVVNAAGAELPKGFVVCARGGGQTVFLSQLNTSTLFRRSGSLGIE